MTDEKKRDIVTLRILNTEGKILIPAGFKRWILKDEDRRIFNLHRTPRQGLQLVKISSTRS